MAPQTSQGRVFLFLQGPHGPFFNRLGKMLRAAGVDVWRVGFNAGDRAFWFHPRSYIPFRGSAQEWPDTFASLLDEKSVTDIVLYGDTRPIHAQAVAQARARGLTVHVFEEGYMRPYWVTYERGGTNGNSRLMEMSIAQMQKALEKSDMEAPLPPGHWGDMRQHVFYGALYHWFVMFRNGDYRNFRPHRDLPVTKEFQLYLKRLLLMPVQAVERRLATLRIRLGGFPYHLALLQLEHDSSFQMHSPFDSMSDFLELVIDGFATGAPQHHHLVVKAHPLEDGRVPVRREIRRLARARRLRPGPFRARRQAGAIAQRCAHRCHRQLHRRATGALARHTSQGFRQCRLCKTGIRIQPATGRVLSECRAPRQQSLQGFPPLPA